MTSFAMTVYRTRCGSVQGRDCGDHAPSEEEGWRTDRVCPRRARATSSHDRTARQAAVRLCQGRRRLGRQRERDLRWCGGKHRRERGRARTLRHQTAREGLELPRCRGRALDHGSVALERITSDQGWLTHFPLTSQASDPLKRSRAPSRRRLSKSLTSTYAIASLSLHRHVTDPPRDTQKTPQLFDVNEAFAAQWLSVQRELDLPNDKSNVFGGAIGRFSCAYDPGSRGSKVDKVSRRFSPRTPSRGVGRPYHGQLGSQPSPLEQALRGRRSLHRRWTRDRDRARKVLNESTGSFQFSRNLRNHQCCFPK